MEDLKSTLNEKIEKINDGYWTIHRNDFFVEIEIQNGYFKEISQSELESISKQINCFKKHKISKSTKKTFKKFLEIYTNIKVCCRIVGYFDSFGITKFNYISRKLYDSIFDIFLPIAKDFKSNDQKEKYLIGEFQNYAFKNIGKIIQTVQDPYTQLLPYIIGAFGEPIHEEVFEEEFKLFLDKQPSDVIFDLRNLGCSFCQYFSDIKISDLCKTIYPKDEQIYEQITNFNDRESSSFIDRIRSNFNKSNLLFLKVSKPVHCFHCIKSIWRILSHYKCQIILNQKTVIFCDESETFSKQLYSIANEGQSNLTFFIVHPEFLDEKDHMTLVEFINERMKNIHSKLCSNIIVISSTDYRQSCIQNSKLFDDIEIKIGKDLLDCLYELSHPDPHDQNFYRLYFSQKAGEGKTLRILNDFEKVKEKLSDKDKLKCELKSFFIDASMTNLPKLGKNDRFVHYDISSELFESNYKLFDDLWKLSIMNFQLNPDGTPSNAPEEIFFEVPALAKDQYHGSGFIEKTDFPIYVNEYHQVSFAKKDDIQLPEKVRTFCDKLFERNITVTIDLLQTAAHMFYPGFEFKEENFIPRLLNSVNVYLEEFCDHLSDDDEKSLPIFLLLIRTNFHIWNMESIFENQKQPKSFIIISCQNLFSSNPNFDKLSLLCFSSNDEHIEWDTSCLKGHIRDSIKKIEDSTLFSNDFFKGLLECNEIDVFSNQNNYDDNQAYFFDIIRTCFYMKDDKKSAYMQITDGIILNHLNYSAMHDQFDSYWTNIYDGREFYEANQKAVEFHKWSPLIETFHNILVRYNDQMSEITSKLTDNKTVKKISSTQLTVTFVKRFISMLIRIFLKQPFILDGLTGVGKTLSIELLKAMTDAALLNRKKNSDFKWSFHQINCFEVNTIDRVTRRIVEELNSSKQEGLNHIFFFDELNTSPLANFVVNEMSNHNIMKTLIQNNPDQRIFRDKSIVFIATMNPYLKISKFTRNMTSYGLQQEFQNSQSTKFYLLNDSSKNYSFACDDPDQNILLYNVKEIYESSKYFIIRADPEIFFFSEEDQKENSEYFTSEERKTVYNIICNYMNIFQYKYKCEDDLRFVIGQKKLITDIIFSLLSKSFIAIRELTQMKSILSYRDAKRCMQLFNHFIIKFNIVLKREEVEIDDIFIHKIIPWSIVLSIMISIVFRFSDKLEIETSDGFLSFSNEEEEEILKRFEKYDVDINFSKDRRYVTLDIRSVLMKILNSSDWNGPIIKPNKDDWMNIVISYAWLKCTKYINYKEDDDDDDENSPVLKTNSLMINLLAISACYSASKKEFDSTFPCILNGFPGSSKSTAIRLFTNYKYLKHNESFCIKNYLSTRIFKPSGLKSNYEECAAALMSSGNSLVFCTIDGFGLEFLNNSKNLAFLHSYLEEGVQMMSSENEGKTQTVPVLSLISSNYPIDYSSMNRSIFICSDLPNDEDISEAAALFNAELIKPLIIEKRINKFKKNFFVDNDFLKWKTDIVHKNKNRYIDILSRLWKLTKDGQRPKIISIKYLYKILTLINSNDQNIEGLNLWLSASLSLHPNDSIVILKKFLGDLKGDYDNAKNLYSLVNDQIRNSSFHSIIQKDFILRTHNYECLDFIKELIKKAVQEDKEEEEDETKVDFLTIFPSDFMNSQLNTVNGFIGKIIGLFKKIHYTHYVLIVGNTPIIDAIFDLIIGKPIINYNGYSIQLFNECPSNVHFIFILNDSDFDNLSFKHTFPTQILYELNQIYLDYNYNDEYGIINNYQKSHLQNKIYSVPYVSFIHDYFGYFVHNLKDIPEIKDRNTFAIVFATKDVEKTDFGKDVLYEKLELDESEYDIKWEKKIILLTIPPKLKKFVIANRNLERLQNEAKDKNYEIICYWSDEYDKLYSFVQKKQIQFPLPMEYMKEQLCYDGTINNLINDKAKDGDTFCAIVLTMSPISEEINFDLVSAKGIKQEDTKVLFDKFIQNGNDLIEIIENTDQKNILIRSDHFQVEHDLLLREQLEKVEEKSNLIIIYHLENNAVPEGLNSTGKWPVYWIESTTTSLLSKYKIQDIANCILFKDVYKELCENLFVDMLIQVYDELVIAYYIPIDHDKIRPILTEVYECSSAHFHPMREVFRDLFYQISGKKKNDSFVDVHIKRQFFGAILDQIPFLVTFVRMLILNAATINENDIDKTLIFIDKFFDYNIETLLDISEIQTRKYIQAARDKLYFPELILPQVFSLYNSYVKKEDLQLQKIDKTIFKIFNDLQSNKSSNNIRRFLSTYLIDYLSESPYFLLDFDYMGGFNQVILDEMKFEEKEANKEKDEEKKDDKKEPFRAVILTLTPMMDEIVFDDENLQCNIQEDNTEILYDSSIRSTEDLEKRIRSTSKENIIIRSNKFRKEHDDLLRNYLEQSEDKKRLNLFIIYSLRLNRVPEGLSETEKWKVFWIESITRSFLPNRESPNKI